MAAQEWFGSKVNVQISADFLRMSDGTHIIRMFYAIEADMESFFLQEEDFLHNFTE